MKIKRLFLRGAIGLKPYGEEISIDFEAFDSGLVCITGQNGAGKSTILESLTPWPMMITRGGSLANYFYLKDSAKELEFEYGGHAYISKIAIDGVAGKLEATLFRDCAPLNDGKVPSYKKLCDEIFGDPELFFKSIFLSQAGERIPQMTAGEKKSFFISLLGLEKYDRLVDATKKKQADISSEIQRLRNQSESLQVTIDRNREKIEKKPEIEQGIADIKAAIVKLQAEIDKINIDIEAARKEEEERRQLNAKLEYTGKEKGELIIEVASAINSKASTLREYRDSLYKLESEVNQLHSKINSGSTIRARFDRLEKSKTEKSRLDQVRVQVIELRASLEKFQEITRQYDETTNQYADLECEIAELQGELSKGDSIRADKARYDELEFQIKTATESRQELAGIKVKLDGEKEKARLWRESLQKDIDRLTREYDSARSLSGNLDAVPCKHTPDFVSTCPMIAAAREASKSANDISVKVSDALKQLEGKYPGQAVIDELEAQYETRELLTPDDKDYAKLQNEYKTLQSKNLSQLLTALDKTAGVITEKQKQLGSLQEKLAGMAPADPAAIKNLESQIAELKFDESAYADLMKDIAYLESQNLPQLIKDIEAAVVTIEEKKKQVEELSRQMAAAEMDYNQRIAALQEKLESKNTEYAKIKAEIDRPLVYNLAILESNKRLKSEQHQNELTALGESRNALNGITALIHENEELELRQAALDGEVDNLDRELSDWNLLEKAFGKNGLQALELDAAGPAIAGIATEMIQEFGRNWSISINTVKNSADDKKQIETFDIIVNTPEGSKNFNLLSGGEQVWVSESIRKAITIYLNKFSFRDYRTIFQDEADGALDPERAMAFLETSLKAHQLTGAHHTLIITQRREISDRIPQRIELYPEEHRIEIVRD